MGGPHKGCVKCTFCNKRVKVDMYTDPSMPVCSACSVREDVIARDIQLCRSRVRLETFTKPINTGRCSTLKEAEPRFCGGEVYAFGKRPLEEVLLEKRQHHAD